MKPEDGQYTRKGERDGKKLTPGERAINWAKALAIIVPLIGIGAVADDPVKRWIGFTKKTEVKAEGMSFEESVQRFSEETHAEIDRLKNDDTKNKSEIQKQLNQLSKRLERIEELVN